MDKSVWPGKEEEDKMYSKREIELIQQYLQKYGKMRGGGEEDNLF
jgi:hypothetical protein